MRIIRLILVLFVVAFGQDVEPTDAPTEPSVEAKVPTDTVSSEAPDAPTDAPAEHPTDAPVEHPNTPVDIPTEHPIDIPTEHPTDAPVEHPNAPTEHSSRPSIRGPNFAFDEALEYCSKNHVGGKVMLRFGSGGCSFKCGVTSLFDFRPYKRVTPGTRCNVIESSFIKITGICLFGFCSAV